MQSITGHQYAIIQDGKVHSFIKEDFSWCECGVDNVDKDGNITHNFCIKTVDITNYRNKENILEGDYYDLGRKLFYKEDEIWSNEECKYIPDVAKIEARRKEKLLSDAKMMFYRDEKYTNAYYWNRYTESQRDELTIYLDQLQDIINGNDILLPTRPTFLP